jgi:hypothetical protein
VILVPGVIKHRMVSIPNRQIQDVHVSRTLPGRLAGYGSLTLTPGRAGYEALIIKYVPYPDQLFLEVRYLLFDEVAD